MDNTKSPEAERYDRDMRRFRDSLPVNDAINLALTWQAAAEDNKLAAKRMKRLDDYVAKVVTNQYEDKAAIYTACANGLLRLTGCPSNRQP